VKVLYAADCSCKASCALAGGGVPEHYPSESEAARAFLAHEERFRLTNGEHKYYAVHARGRHVIGVILG
jgi:hypothetical protein